MICSNWFGVPCSQMPQMKPKQSFESANCKKLKEKVKCSTPFLTKRVGKLTSFILKTKPLKAQLSHLFCTISLSLSLLCSTCFCSMHILKRSHFISVCDTFILSPKMYSASQRKHQNTLVQP